GSAVGRSADMMKSSIGRGAGAVKSGIGRGTSAVKSSFGKGAGAVKSGFSRSTSAIKGLFSKNKNEKNEDRSPEVKDYKKMKVADLKAELKEKGLSTAGKKADLIKRLES
ncbi:MAG: SAP domain-containing protein, partial [Candidatus Thermoplasmatota archaeon]|nr:SAP domain-containing protein [Candidatus Thermoplasmatota archaeon]